MTEQTKFTPDEAINEFYRLKNKYESTYYDKYVKQIIRSNKSKREKRVEYSKLPKHECINCKRNVGTLWEINIDKKNNIRYFKAKCGDINEPCPLDIQIDCSVRESMYKEIIIGLAEIEKIKLNIIKEKNNALFFKKEVVTSFNKLTEELKFETNHTGFIIESNILTNDNPEKAVLLKKTIDEFGKGFILPFKKMVKDFDETNNELILNQAVNFYMNEILPKLKEILLLKYDVSMLDFDETQNIYKLIQLPNSLESNEYYVKGDDKVVKFIRSVRNDKNKTRKLKLDTSNISKKKTRKLKPVAELVLEDEEEEIIEPGEEGVIKEKLESKFGQQEDIESKFDE